MKGIFYFWFLRFEEEEEEGVLFHAKFVAFHFVILKNLLRSAFGVRRLPEPSLKCPWCPMLKDLVFR